MKIFKVFKENEQLRELQSLSEELDRVISQLSSLEREHYKAFKVFLESVSEDKEIKNKLFGKVIMDIISSNSDYFKREDFKKVYDLKMEIMILEHEKDKIETNIGNLKVKLFGKFHF